MSLTTNPTRDFVGSLEIDLNMLRRDQTIWAVLLEDETDDFERWQRGKWVHAIEEEGDIRDAEIIYVRFPSVLLMLDARKTRNPATHAEIGGSTP